jgi:hypothetical protein
MSKVQLQGNVSGTGVFTIASPNSNTDRTQTLPDASGTLLNTGSTAVVTQAMLAPNVAGNGPAFSAFPGSNRTISSAVLTTVICDTEVFDTNGCFNPTGSTVTLNGISVPPYSFAPNVAGYYLMTATCNTELSVSASRYILNVERADGAFRIEDTSVGYAPSVATGSILLYFNGTGDWARMSVFIAATTPTYSSGFATTRFSGHMVRAV